LDRPVFASKCIAHKLTRNGVPSVIGSDVTVAFLTYPKHFLAFVEK